MNKDLPKGFDEDKLRELERLLNKSLKIVREILGTTEGEDRYYALLRKIYEAGGKMIKEEFHRIARELGYDTRGLGGFFVGPNRPLTYIVEGGEEFVALTPVGYKIVSD